MKVKHLMSKVLDISGIGNCRHKGKIKGAGNILLCLLEMANLHHDCSFFHYSKATITKKKEKKKTIYKMYSKHECTIRNM